LLTARSDRFDPVERNHQQQFGGISFGVGGLGIPIFGGGGAPIGGISGSGFGAGVGGGGIGPLLTLENAFGLAFSAEQIRRQIEAGFLDAEETGESVPTVIPLETGAIVSIVLNLASGLFEIFENASGQKLGGGVTPQAAIDAVNAGGGVGGGGGGAQPPTFPEPLTAVTSPPFVAPPQPPAPIASPENLRFFLGLVSDLFRRGDRPLGSPLPPPPIIPQFPPFPFPGPPSLPPPPPRVEVGGTVNVPVVLGSTGDPTGVRRPTFPDKDQLSRAQQIGQIIRDLLALRKARQNADKQRRAFEQFLAARLAQLGGQQMPFGQAGFAAGALVPSVGSFLGNVGADILAGLISPGQPQAVPSLPAFPMAPTQGPLLGGGGGACPPLFRGGAPAGFRMSPVPWFPVQAPNGKWFFFGHLGTPTFSKLKARRRHHHHSRKR